VANFCDAGDKRSGYIKCTVVTFCVKSKVSAGKVGILVIADAVAQLKCVCARACVRVYVLAFESGARQLTPSWNTVTVVMSLTDSVSVMTPSSG
jgi:hypothetical protein